jgi:ribosomal protein S18 acetylase RimI-like enzyme
MPRREEVCQIKTASALQLTKMNFSLARSVSVDEFRDLLLRSTLSARRPIDDLDCLRQMLDNSEIIATSWSEELLVGIARSITDFSYCCYLSDLAVDVAFQKQGIGTELISLTQSMLGPHCKIILLSAPAAVDYYRHIGLEPHPSAWLLPSKAKLSRERNGKR